MCIMCIEIMKQQMSLTEAGRNLGEIVNDLNKDSHYGKLKEAIDEMDVKKLNEVLIEGNK